MSRIYNLDGSYYEGMTPPTYPMRPLNGGPLTSAPNVARYSRDPAWRFEPKLNGWRALVNDDTGDAFNRHLQPLSIRSEFGAALKALWACGGVCPWWDCEALERRHKVGQGSLILLDWVPVSGTGVRDYDYLNRRRFIETWGEQFDWQWPVIGEDKLYCLPSFDYETAIKFWDLAPTINQLLGCTFYEGVVAKRSDSEYLVQLRSDAEETPTWIKHRFTSAP